MKTMSKWVVVGLLLLGSRAWAQPAAREFYQKSMSATFNAQMLVANLGRRAADRIIEYLEGEGAGTAMAYTAVQQLPMTGHPRAVPVLTRFLSEDSPVGPQWQMAIRPTAIDGLAPLDTPASRRALAAALGGPGVVNNFIELFEGDPSALTGIAMALGDIISLCLIAPVLFTALALRGGLFGWPWWLLTASLLSWLLYDGVLEIGPYLGAGEQTVRSVSEMFRAMACLFEFSAGLAQRHVVKRTKEDTQA